MLYNVLSVIEKNTLEIPKTKGIIFFKYKYTMTTNQMTQIIQYNNDNNSVYAYRIYLNAFKLAFKYDYMEIGFPCFRMNYCLSNSSLV